MKLLLLLSVVATVVVAVPYGLDQEFAMVPDSDGNWKLVNINEDPEPESFFNPVSDVRFLLFTRRNPDVPQILSLDEAVSIESSNFNAAHPTRFTIHGWNSDAGAGVNVLSRRNYLQLGEFNVITVDWSLGAQTINYVAARNRVGPVGSVVAQMIQKLHRVNGVIASDIAVVGHSLGAHVAGFAGKNIVANMRMGYIVALDAALPLFSIDQPGQRVDSGDANYVESIHTNAGNLGFDEPLGDASFYPNFGTRQPGCGLDVSGNCAHGRAVEFFAESITTTRHFWSRQCSGYQDILMERCTPIGIDRKMGGEPVETLARGIYWTRTNNNSPFATGIL